jgi:DNA-binding LacI/PurR family transcriptional regulator
MPKNTRPALDRAYSHVHSILKSGSWRPEGKLPAIRSMARAADVSLVTMWKAVDQLKRDGLVAVKQGGRIRPSGTSATPRENVTHPRWERKRDLVAEDIARGVFGDRLPSMGDLRLRYGMGYTTCRRVLDSLAESRIIRPHGRTYTVPGLRAGRSSMSIVFMSGGYSSDMIDLARGEWGWFVPLFQSLEQQCMQAGLGLIRKGIASERESLIGEVRELLRERDDIAGFVINAGWRTLTDMNRFLALLTELSIHRKPVAVLDAGGLVTLSTRLAGRGYVRVFRLSEREAGRIVGRELLAHNHREIAWFGLPSVGSWSEERLAGISRAYADAGMGSGVHSFVDTTDGAATFLEVVASVSGLDTDIIGRIFAVDYPREAVAEILDHVVHHRSATKGRGVARGMKARIRKVLGNLVSLVDEGMPASLVRELRLTMFAELHEGLMKARLARSMHEARAARAISAWVGHNDAMACSLFDLCREQGIRVPGDISIVGFDNTDRACQYDCASYAIDVAHMARRLLAHATGVKGRSTKTAETFTGSVIVRGSLARRQAFA